MSLRLTVTYPATDGIMPESVELTWEDENPPPDHLMSALALLLAAPAERLSITRGGITDVPADAPRPLPDDGGVTFGDYIAGEYIPAGSVVAVTDVGRRVLNLYRAGCTTRVGTAVDVLEPGDSAVAESSSTHGTIWRRARGKGDKP